MARVRHALGSHAGHRCAGRGGRAGAGRRTAPRQRLPVASGLQHPSLGNRAAALRPPARGPGYRAGPRDDPARLVHDEAERDDRDVAGDLPSVRIGAPVRAAGPNPGLSAAVRGARGDAVRHHRVRRVLAAAERRLARRICGAAGDPRLPPEPRRGAARRLPDPRLGARHESGQRGDGGFQGGGRGLRRERQRFRRRSRGQGGRVRRPAGRADDHLSFHARRLRSGHRRHLCDRASPRRPGLHGRGEPERSGRDLPAGADRRGCLAHQPAQDLLYSAWWRRSGHGADRCPPPPRAVPARSSGRRGRQSGRGRQGDHRYGVGRALGLGKHPDDLLGLHRHDGCGGTDTGHAGCDPQCELRRGASGTALPDPLHGQERAGRA